MPQTSSPLGGEQGRCGFGPRLPMMVISPFARRNSVDHNLNDQASIIKLRRVQLAAARESPARTTRR